MKKLVTLLTLCLLCVCCAVGFTACEDDNGAILPPDTPAHTHEYVETVIKTPTCVEKGEKTYTCDCGNSYTEEIPALGHGYTAETTVPICTEQGYTTYTCTRCGNSYNGNYTAPLGHDYEWTTTKEPTETEKGEEQGVCKLCGDTIIKPIAELNHIHNYIETIIEPTCLADGYTLHKCVCEDEYITDETAALGHTPAVAVEENMLNATCTEDGSYDSVVYCSVCGEEISREIRQYLQKDILLRRQ